MFASRDYREGYNAYRCGRPEGCNPNKPGTERFYEWRLGYETAEDNHPELRLAA